MIAILRKILTVKGNRKLNMSIIFKVQVSTTVTEINAYTLLNAYPPSELEMIKRNIAKIRSLQFNIYFQYINLSKVVLRFLRKSFKYFFYHVKVLMFVL